MTSACCPVSGLDVHSFASDGAHALAKWSRRVALILLYGHDPRQVWREIHGALHLPAM